MGSDIAALLVAYMAVVPAKRAGTMPKAKRSKINTLQTDPADDCGALAVAELPDGAELLDEQAAHELCMVEAGPLPTKRYVSAVRKPSNLQAYVAQPVEKQRDILKREWSNLAYVLVERANTYAKTITKKDFGRLMQLVTTAGIAHDKVMPKADGLVQGNLIVNMFGSLDSNRLGGVVGTTVIDSTAVEVAPQEAQLAGTPPANANKVPGQG